MISVLLVDDEEVLCDLTRIYLEERGDITVIPVLSASDALSMMEYKSFDAIVSDYEMPGMNGIDFLKAVKSRGDDTPIIIFTGRGREVVTIEALNNGASFYLQKGGDVAIQYAELRNMIIQAVQRRQSEIALRTSEARYRAVVESQMELICRFHPDGTLLFVNSAFCRYYGKRAEDLLGERFAPGWFDEDLPMIQRYFASFTPDNPTAVIQRRIRCPRAGIRWQQWSDTAIFNDQGGVIEFQSVGRDITDRKITEEKLTNTLSLITATLESTDNGILVLGHNGEFIKANRRFAEMWDVPDDLLITGGDDRLLSHMQIQLTRPARFIGRNMESGACSDTDTCDRLFLRNGRVFESDTRMMIVAGEHRGRVCSFLDITERVRAEKVLKEANKKLHLLNTVTRHDVLNQLTALSSLLHIARSKGGPNTDSLLGRAEDVIGIIGHQIAFMSDYQDIDIHTPHWQRPASIIRNVSTMIHLDQVQISCDCSDCEVYADPLLEKVFYNLVDNAIRHGGGVSRIQFYSKKEGDKLVIFCQDDGRGVAADEKEEIFKLGYGKHTGFGLYLAREILSITGICMDETGMAGRGALFRLMVPRESYRNIQDDSHTDECQRQCSAGMTETEFLKHD